jgi:signal transduction histidine kinase
VPAAVLHLRRLTGQAVPLVGIASAAVGVVAVHRSIHAGTTYAGISTGAHVADLAAGLGLVGAGVAAWLDGNARRLGAIAMLAGAAWFASDWEGWYLGPPLVRSLGAVAAPLSLAFVFHLVLAAPSGRVRSRLSGAGIGTAYAVAILAGVGRALFRDPILDPYCWRNCLDNVFLVHPDQAAARFLDRLWLVAAVSAGGLLLVTGAWRLANSTGPALRLLSPVLVPGALVGAAQAAYAVALLHNPLEPRNTTFYSLFLARSLALTALALGLLWTVVRARRLRAAVARLGAEIDEAPPPGALQEALALAVGDPTLEVAYWLPASNRYVGADGKSVGSPAPREGRAVTPIVRAGRPLAVVVHDASLGEGAAFARQLGSAARLAVENERLQAEVRAQLEDLRASRARIVESGDAARRRLERNLHDGAQQRLLALSYDLRLARSDAEHDRDPELTALLVSAAEEAQAALLELRDLAHGIYPAILGEAGLAPALATLADEASLPVELRHVTEERYDAPVETAAYLTVSEAIVDASRRQATFVAAVVRPHGDLLVVTADDDGSARDTSLVELADRIGALGGTLYLGPKTLRADIPCV